MKDNRFVEKAMRTYREELSCFSPGQWFQVPKDFLFIMECDEAIVMSFLINAADMFLALERYAGWFYYTMSTMEAETGMARNKQTRVLRKLEDKGFIKRKRIGNPSKRYFWIDILLLKEKVFGARQLRRQKRKELRKVKVRKIKGKLMERINEDRLLGSE